jgi:hypothetical protein
MRKNSHASPDAVPEGLSSLAAKQIARERLFIAKILPQSTAKRRKRFFAGAEHFASNLTILVGSHNLAGPLGNQKRGNK